MWTVWASTSLVTSVGATATYRYARARLQLCKYVIDCARCEVQEARADRLLEVAQQLAKPIVLWPARCCDSAGCRHAGVVVDRGRTSWRGGAV